MTVSANMFSRANLNAYLGNITDLSAGGTAVKVALLTSAASPNLNTWDSYANLTNEVTGTGYTAGGETLTGKTLTTSNTATVTFDAEDVSWESSTITARYAVVYDAQPASDSNKKLLVLVNFGEDFSSSDGTFEIQWHNDGIFTVTRD
jgi:hypothetical protein